MSSFDKQLKKLFKKLNHASSAPSADWLAATRVKLRQHLREFPVPRIEHFSQPLGWWQSLWVRPAAVLAVVLVAVLALGGGSAWAAQSANPGEPLYPLKIVTEKVAITVSVSPQAKARLYLKYADRRLGELETLYEKEAGSSGWQEKVVADLGQSLAGAKGNIKIDDFRDISGYAELALDFDSLVERQRGRLKQLEDRLNTTTVEIINQAQAAADKNFQNAFEALTQAQSALEVNASRTDLNQKRFDSLQERIAARLERLRARQELLRQRQDDKLDNLQASTTSIQVLTTESDETKLDDSDNEAASASSQVRVYEEEVDDGDTYFESWLEIEGDDNESVETDIEINNGQAIINSSIKATGTSVIIKESSRLIASSSQTFIIDSRSGR